MQHLVFDIKRFAVHDGPGIRTTVFLKGCELNCPWCQNPEGLTVSKKLLYDQTTCIGCHLCVEACPTNAISPLRTEIGKGIALNRKTCDSNGECVKVCPTHSLKFDAQFMTPEMILEEVLKDQIFYKKDEGGVTFSGGDPLFNSEFLLHCIELCKKEKLHVAVETSLMKDWIIIEKLIGKVDLFIVDIKIFSSQKHDKIVGGSGELIKENIRKLNRLKQAILLRTPLIPGYTGDNENLQQIGAFYKALAKENEKLSFELLNTNPYAKSKYRKLGLPIDKALEERKYSDEEMKNFYRISGVNE